MPSSPVHDLAPHRRESTTKQREMRPLMTHEPLSRDREKKQPVQPQRRRKRVVPTTPPLSFDPKRHRDHVPLGKQDPSVLPKPPVSDSVTGSYDGRQMTPSADRETPSYNGWPRIVPDTSSYTDTPYPDMNDMNSVPPESYDSPTSHTSSSSPDPPDHSPCTGIPSIEYPRQPSSMPMYQHEPVYTQPSVIHQSPYGYSMDPFPDRAAQNFPAQCFDPAYGRSGLHGGPVYPGNNGCYPPTRRQ